jgi:hypothetical protein
MLAGLTTYPQLQSFALSDCGLAGAGKRHRPFKYGITPFPPFSEARRDQFVRFKRLHLHRLEFVEPKANVPVRTGVGVVVLSSLVPDTEVRVR